MDCIAQENAKQDGLALMTFQAQLCSIASLRFIYAISFNWWTKDFAKLSPASVIAQWVDCFEQSYGDMLAQSTIQKMLGEQVNLAIKGWQDGLPRL